MEPEGARVGVTDVSLTSLACLKIVLLQIKIRPSYSIFSHKLLKYALRAKKMAESALRADTTLCPTLAWIMSRVLLGIVLFN